MKHIQESIRDRKNTDNFYTFPGTVKWRCFSKEYEFSETISGNKWRTQDFDTEFGKEIIFYDPDSPWVISIHINDIKKFGIARSCALFSPPQKMDWSELTNMIIDDYTGLLVNSATIPTLDLLQVTDIVKLYLKRKYNIKF